MYTFAIYSPDRQLWAGGDRFGPGWYPAGSPNVATFDRREYADRFGRLYFPDEDTRTERYSVIPILAS